MKNLLMAFTATLSLAAQAQAASTPRIPNDIESAVLTYDCVSADGDVNQRMSVLRKPNEHVTSNRLSFYGYIVTYNGKTPAQYFPAGIIVGDGSQSGLSYIWEIGTNKHFLLTHVDPKSPAEFEGNYTCETIEVVE